MPRIRSLLEEGTDPNATDEWGRTALHIAAGTDHTGGIVELLMEHGANLGARAPGGLRPVHLVGHVEAARALLAHGADINAKDDHGRTPLHHVVGTEHARVMEREVWPRRSQFRRTDVAEHRALVEFLISRGADLDATGDTGGTPLHAACRAGHLDDVKILVESGANVATEDGLGLTPLDRALLSKYAKDLSGNNGAIPSAMPKGEHALVVDYLDSRGAPKSGTVEEPK